MPSKRYPIMKEQQENVNSLVVKNLEVITHLANNGVYYVAIGRKKITLRDVAMQIITTVSFERPQRGVEQTDIRCYLTND
jgi:hypothetical protein